MCVCVFKVNFCSGGGGEMNVSMFRGCVRRGGGVRRKRRDGDETEQKRQRECLTQTEPTIPAGVCQQADMQIFFLFFFTKPPDVSKAQVKGLHCAPVCCSCDCRGRVPVTSAPVQHRVGQ